jgi:hypothetical protein
MNRSSPSRDGVLRSKVLPREIEAELRVDVLDGGFVSRDDNPQVIITNHATGCRGHYYPNRTQDGQKMFVFWHSQMVDDAIKCDCIIKSEPGSAMTWVIPEVLDKWRTWLVTELNLESKFVAMVVVKLYLGMYVPEPLNGPFPQEEQIEWVTEGETKGSGT